MPLEAVATRRSVHDENCSTITGRYQVGYGSMASEAIGADHRRQLLANAAIAASRVTASQRTLVPAFPIGAGTVRTSRSSPFYRPRNREPSDDRSEEHTSELQSLRHLVCRLLLEKKKKTIDNNLIH